MRDAKKGSSIRAALEVLLLLALAFAPVYVATFTIDAVSPDRTRGIPLAGAVFYFAVMPTIWIVASEFLAVVARILGATIMQGGRGSRYLGEFLGNLLCVVCLAVFECLYFSSFSAAFASAALACLLYKAAEPVCYRLFPCLKDPHGQEHPAENEARE